MGSNRERKKKKEKEKKKALKHRFAKPKSPDDPIVVFSPPGEVKMSEVLWDFIEPYADTWETEDQLRKLIVVALVAWNAAISPVDRAKSLVESTMATLPPDAREDYLQVIAELMERKLMFFADNTRMIIDYKLTMTDDGPHVTVISSLPT